MVTRSETVRVFLAHTTAPVEAARNSRPSGETCTLLGRDGHGPTGHGHQGLAVDVLAGLAGRGTRRPRTSPSWAVRTAPRSKKSMRLDSSTQQARLQGGGKERLESAVLAVLGNHGPAHDHIRLGSLGLEVLQWC